MIDPFTIITITALLLAGIAAIGNKLNKSQKGNSHNLAHIISSITKVYPLKKNKKALLPSDRKTPTSILNGVIDNIPITIKIIVYYDSTLECTIQIDHKILTKDSFKFKLTKEDDTSRFKQNLMKPDFQTGDPVFDREINIETDEEEPLLILLNKKRRKHIIAASDNLTTLEITKNSLSASILYDDSVVHNDAIIYLIETIISLAKNLIPEGSLEETLINNFNDGDIDQLILNNIAAANKLHMTDKKTKRSIKKLIYHHSPLIQYTAACQSGNEGLKHLKSMLISHKNLNNQLIINIIDEIKRWSYIDAVPQLVTVSKENSDLSHHIIRGLRNLKHDAAAPYLHEVIKFGETHLRLSAIRSLGYIGTEKDSAFLHEYLIENQSPAVYKRVKEAHSMIKSRLKGKEGGWVSLDDNITKEGNLSMSNNKDSGKLTIKDEIDQN